MKTIFHLDQNELPRRWYNVLADLDRPLDPPLHPGTREPITREALETLFPKTCVEQEVSTDRFIDIPDPVAYDQIDVFKSAVLFAGAEGIIPAPETAHAVHAAVEVARECTRTGDEKTILIGFSGHGHFDMGAYSAYLDGHLS